jgi:hypothetical protein
LTRSIAHALEAALAAQVGAAASEWLFDARRYAAAGPLAELLRVYTDASRQLGRGRLVLNASHALPPALEHVIGSRWTLEDTGRLLLLLARAESASGSIAAAAIECYEQGDAREQESWLRAVAFLPEPQQYLPTVIDACRTSILPLFEAVACENLYPAGYFPERNFNQMVLKALFNAVALNRIQRLPERLNPELSRMANDYAAERRAAGRSIPADISLAMLDRAAAPVKD